MKTRAAAVHPFVGNSTMDGLLRQIDWSATSIGTPDTWPGTWRAAMRMVLDSFAPMVLLLGEEMLMVYNDACMPVVGGKHPRCLGKSARERGQTETAGDHQRTTIAIVSGCAAHCSRVAGF